MKTNIFGLNRIVAAAMLLLVFAFAFVWTRTSASERSSDGVRVTKKNSGVKSADNAVTLDAARRGFPLINLQDGKRLDTEYVGSESATGSFAAARPLAIANADLNLDGAGDLIVSYAGSSGGHLALYTGNPDSLSARTPESFEAIKEGRFPTPFLPEARLIELSVTPDFIGTGDFNRDGWKDIVAAQRGSNSLVLLAGNSKGSYKTQNIELPGGVTALLTENIDPADGQPDVAVALSDTNGSWLFVFADQHNVFAGQPRMYPLPGEATSLALGQLDNSTPMDILAAAGGKAVVIHGSYAENKDSSESQVRANAGQIETLNVGSDVSAVRIGHFVWDRENRPEIALLGAGGTIRILQRGNIDRRKYSEEEWEAHWTRQEEQDQIELQRRSSDSTNRAIQVQTNQSQQRLAAQIWTEADSFQLSSGYDFRTVSPSSVFTSARMTTQGVDNLIIADSSSRKIKVLLQNNAELKVAGGESAELSATGDLAAVEFDSSATPMSVLPMRLGVLTRPGLVMVDQETGGVSYAVAAPEATFTVTKTADTFDGTCDADCSLREAVGAANLAAGADIVTVPAGTYTLTIGPSDDSPADPTAQGSGDLDIRQDLTITGAGQATTIIQAGPTAATGIDRVLHTRQTSVGIPDISISGVTIRNGRCSSAGSIANPNGARCNTGGAGLLHSVDDIASVTISDSTFTTNWNVATNAGTGVFFLNGAGIFIGRGDTVMTNVTFTGNENGATGSDNGGDGGGVLFGFSSAVNINTAVLNNVTMAGNIARIIGSDTLGGNGGGLNHAYDDVDINGGNYSNNIADLDGGAFYLLTKTDLFNNATVTGNTAKRDGGGIWSDPLNTDGTPATNTMVGLTVRNNTADSDGIIHPQFPGDPRGSGGGIYHDRGTLTMTTVTLGGTSAGQPNTAFDGGGLGHRYRAQASTTNVSTITINGGSILGNVANNDGGGIFHDATRTAGANSTLSVAPATAVLLTNNTARNNGGGVSNSGGASATFNNMVFRNNTANSDNSGGGDGGAYYQNTAATTIFNGTLSIGGAGSTNSAANGGGISNAAGTVTFPANATITSNTASGSGGGINNGGTINSFTTPTISSNTATGNGGGINNTGTITLNSATISGNTAAAGSAIQQVTSGTATLSGANGITGNINIAGGTLIGFTGSTNTLIGNFSQSGGTFTGNNSLFNITGNFVYTGGTFSAGTGAFNFNGSSAQSITGAVSFNNLTITNPAGVNLNSSITLLGGLALPNGTLAVGTNTLTLNGTVSASGGSLSSGPTGTVNYNQGANFQSVLAANYGNLTFSNFIKTLPAAVVGIAGTFTPGTAVGHTVTGNTINFNGTGLQSIPAFTYNNLTLNNSAGANLTGNITLNGTLTLAAGNLGVGTNTVTLNGVVTSTGGTFSSAATGTVIYNQSSNGQGVLSGNYGNLTFSNFNKNLTNANIGIAGTFTPGTAIGHTITGSTFTYNGATPQTMPAGFATYNNLTLNNTAGVTGFAGLTVQGLLTVQAGTFTSSSFFNNVQINSGATLAGVAATTINMSGNWTNNGIFTANGNTVNFNGTVTQTIGGTAATTFNNLTINNATGVNLGSNVTVGGSLTLTNGVLGVGTNTLTLNAGTSGAGSLTSSATGTVNYNQPSIGQIVLVANYGNLAFSNFNKTLPAAIVGIAGTFTPGTAVGHTVTGNTISFNGTTAQNAPVFPYNNLTVNNPAGVNLAGSTTVIGTLNFVNGQLSTGANLLTVATTGTVSRTSGHVVGNLRKDFSGPASALELPVGTNGAYSPLTTTVTNGSGFLQVRANTGVPVVTPVPIDATKTLQRYWTLSGTGIRSNLTFQYLDPPDVPSGPVNDETAWNVIRVTGNIVVRYAPGPDVIMDAVNNRFTVNNVESYSDWTAGEPLAPTAASVSVSGRVVTAENRGVSKAQVTIRDANGISRTISTNSFGYFQFFGVAIGTYVIDARHKQYSFASQAHNFTEDAAGLNIRAQP